MAPVASLNAARSSHRREGKNDHEIDLFALMLKVQTLSLQLEDVRNRLSQIERQLNIHHLSQSERAALSSLSRIV